MFSPPDSSSPTHTSNSHSLRHLIETTFSYNGNVMLAAVISLLLVILFVLLLHLYAKWFLAQARQRRRSSMSVSQVLGPTRFHNFHTFTFDTTLAHDALTNGLDLSIIASIPVFLYMSEEHNRGLECVICLSVFEENDIGRNLPKCGHAFHVDCIDMWLHSHSNCPICRAPVLCEKKAADGSSLANDVGSIEGSRELSEVVVSGEAGLVDGDSTLGIIIEVPGSNNLVPGSESLVLNDLLSASSPSSSLKRMLSRNRSERKVYPSSNVIELDA